MITVDQAQSAFGAAPQGDAGISAPAPRQMPSAKKTATRPATQILHATLFLTILISPLVFIEPSPYEFAVAILAFACVIARVTFDKKLLPLLALLLVWNVGGLIAYFNVMDEELTGRFTAISIYMAFSTIVFACLFSADSMRRIMIMRRTYIISAMITALTGIIGYFGLFASAITLFAGTGRASGTFKDPNVFGPFLILPLLFVIQSLLVRGIRFRYLVASAILVLGLFLSFSRGAWMHFGVSALVMLTLMFLTAPTLRARARLVFLSGVIAASSLGLLTAALSLDSVGTMFKERAKVTQDYDVGSGGRFTLQEIAVGSALDHPLGMGPYEFFYRYGGQQHNVYLQAFLVYGWLGGFAYLGLLVSTIAVGLRASFIASPYQIFLIASLGAFVGEIAEGLIIDTDHWRHFFLLLGIIWGLAVNAIHLKAAASVQHNVPGQAPF